ncbi:MAG: hypothetical protein ACLQVJ_01930 [Syntrophobacteraceae bacterium]
MVSIAKLLVGEKPRRMTVKDMGLRQMRETDDDETKYTQRYVGIKWGQDPIHR